MCVCVCASVYIYIAEEPLENKNEVLAPDLNVKNSLMSRRSLRASLMNENWKILALTLTLITWISNLIGKKFDVDSPWLISRPMADVAPASYGREERKRSTKERYKVKHTYPSTDYLENPYSADAVLLVVYKIQKVTTITTTAQSATCTRFSVPSLYSPLQNHLSPPLIPPSLPKPLTSA